MTLPVGPFGTIVADPPWRYSSPGQFAASKATHDTGLSGRAAASSRYDLMSMDDLLALPVADIAASHAHLYLWVTNSFMVEAHALAKAWGFEVKTILTYGKVKADGAPSMKMGYYFRGATEHALFGTRGIPAIRLASPVGLPTLMLWPRLPHSVKPDAFYDMVARVSPGPFIELFARGPREGWATWGDQA